MTVQELIEKLQQIEDKKKTVCCISETDCFYVYSVKEEMHDVFLEEWKPTKKDKK